MQVEIEELKQAALGSLLTSPNHLRDTKGTIISYVS
jgi:hypothetical protein